MKMFKRILSAAMALLTLSLCFVTVLAEDADNAYTPELLRYGYATGTYGLYTYSLNSANSSSTLLKARGDYEIDINIRLRFKAQVCYYSEDYEYVDYSTPKTKTFGPSYDTTLSKSYTMQQWKNAVNLSGVPMGSEFRYCNYSLLLDSTNVTTIADIYIELGS